MALTIREYDPAKDREGTADVFSQVYRSGEPMADDEVMPKENESLYVADVDGRIAGAFLVYHMGCTLAPKGSVKCGGIAGVAVRPEHRGTGVATEMMRFAMDQMRSDGYAITSLYGFRESYYRKFGWEVAGQRLKITCPQHRLPQFDAELPVREVYGDDGWKEVLPAYEGFSRRYSGMNPRTPSQWVQATRGTKKLARLFAAGDPAEAYCVTHVQTQFWEEQHISEFAWSTPRGYRSLMAFFRGVASNKTALTWHEPGDSPFLAEHVDQGVKFEIVRPIMYRALDVQTLLEQLTPDGTGILQLGVRFGSEIEVLEVRMGQGQVRCAPGRESNIDMDVRHFTQAVLGEPSFRTLLEQGAVICTSDNAAMLADELFTPRRAYCMDFF